MIRNSVPIRLGWGNYSDGAVGTFKNLAHQMTAELQSQKDARMFSLGEVFDQYSYADAAPRNFNERYIKREKLKAGWVNDSDFEKNPLD